MWSSHWCGGSLTSDKLVEMAIILGQSRCGEISFDAGKLLRDSAIPFALRPFGSLFSSCKNFPFLPSKAAPVPGGRKSPVVAAGAAGTVLCLLTTGFVVGGFECPCLFKLQLRVSGCVWVSAKSNSHWTLDNLLCPVEVCFYSFVSSGGKK